jgi:tRNA pseudouridine38-40 synthase
VTADGPDRRAYRVAYDGRGYHGFQRQPEVPTVSDAILEALRALDFVADGVPSGYAAAGRTDAGVSASTQTVAFDAPDWLDPAALNGELPADVRAWAGAKVPVDFHATHDATAREYTYYLHAPAADATRVREALELLAGRHDFHNLTPDQTGTVRELSADVALEGAFVVLSVRADGFPRQLVRRLVHAIDRVATGAADRAWLDRLLAEEAVAGPDGVGPAPPDPLVLTDVTYPGVSFDLDEAAAASAREVFATRRAALTARAKVSGRIASDVE